MYGKMEASWLNEFIPCTCTSAIWGQPCFLAHLKEWEIALLASPQLLSYHCGEWWHLLDLSFGNPYSHLEARNCWWLWHFLLIDMAGAISTLHWYLTVMLLMFQQNGPFSMRCYVGVLDCHSGVTAWTHHVVGGWQGAKWVKEWLISLASG